MNNRDILLGLVEGRRVLDGRFTDISRIGPAGGDGNFSLMFTSRDMQSGKRVALKFFNPERLDSYRFACFEREEEILRKLRGEPDILEWVAPRSGFIEALPTSRGPFQIEFSYFATELAVSSLAAEIASGGYDAEQNLVAFRAACRGIQRIHNRQIVHRDVKSGNFLVMANGSLRLSDFGTGRTLDGIEPDFLPNYLGQWPGDRRYSAPEMLAGLYDEERALAYKADIFSLGALLFELFSGTILGLQVFDAIFATQLTAVMSLVRLGRRREIYDQFVDNIVAAHPLPSVADFGVAVPNSIKARIDGLYQSMAALDYRQRLCSFPSIFRQIDCCLLVLRNEDAYQRWLEEKRRRRAIRLEKERSRP